MVSFFFHRNYTRVESHVGVVSRLLKGDRIWKHMYVLSRSNISRKSKLKIEENLRNTSRRDFWIWMIVVSCIVDDLEGQTILNDILTKQVSNHLKGSLLVLVHSFVFTFFSFSFFFFLPLRTFSPTLNFSSSENKQ